VVEKRDHKMKLLPEEMSLFELDYGELVRPAFEILPSRGWGQCTNETSEFLLVYGPKHKRENSTFDTSPYVLPPGATTPNQWDCDGFLLPSDRVLLRHWRRLRRGPLAIKFWDFRRFSVRSVNPGIYGCPWSNGTFEPSQINWAIPNLSYDEIRRRIERAPHG
jgi:hypothetical protein